MIIFLIVVICFILLNIFLEYERKKFLKDGEGKKGQVDEKLYLKWKKGQI